MMSTGLPSSSFKASTSSSSKRHSVAIVPTSAAASGPRPLHLLDLASPTSSSSFLPAAANCTNPLSAPATKHSFSAPHSRSTTPKSSRRQSSLSYFSPNHDRERDFTRAPLAHHHAPSLSSRNGSIGGAGSRNRASVDSSVGGEDRPPLTLAEKHAELLSFIAQKEAKCLELRSQLAVHEEELLQLKRKWERIVNRGIERDTNLSQASNSASNSSSDFPNALMSLTSPALTLEGIREGVQEVSRLLVAGLSMPASGSATADGSSQHTPSSASSSSGLQSNAHSSSPRPGMRPLSASKFGPSVSPLLPSPLSASATSLVDSPDSADGTKPFVRHATHESSSSASTSRTTATTRSNSTAANRLSQCSSATSLDGEDGDGTVGNSVLVRRNERARARGSPQELLMSDTGATPTVSPNPAFLEQKERRRRRQEQAAEKDSGLDGDAWATGRESEDAWDVWGDEVPRPTNGLEEPGHSMKLGDPPSGARQKAARPALDSSPSPMTSNRTMSSLQSPTRSDTSSGFGALASPQSWMGSMGKKLGELQKSTTALAKSQKRASVIFSDMSQSIVSALSSPPGPANSNRSPPPFAPLSFASAHSLDYTFPAPSPPPAASHARKPSKPISLDSTRSATNGSSATGTGRDSGQSAGFVLKSATGSLLDEDDDVSEGGGKDDVLGAASLPLSPSMSVMMPDVRIPPLLIPAATATPTVPEEDEEWNW